MERPHNKLGMGWNPWKWGHIRSRQQTILDQHNKAEKWWNLLDEWLWGRNGELRTRVRAWSTASCPVHCTPFFTVWNFYCVYKFLLKNLFHERAGSNVRLFENQAPSLVSWFNSGKSLKHSEPQVSHGWTECCPFVSGERDHPSVPEMGILLWS